MTILRRPMDCGVKRLILAALAYISLLTAGCGGGGGGSSSGTPTSNPPSQSVTKAVVGYSVANSDSRPLAGIQFSAYLPSGVTVPTTAGTNQINPTNLVAGSALSGLNVQVFGTYSAPLHKVKLGVMAYNAATLQKGLGNGEMLKLTCTVTDSVTAAQFDATNSGKPIADLLGYAYVSGSAIDLSGSLTPLQAVTLN